MVELAGRGHQRVFLLMASFCLGLVVAGCGGSSTIGSTSGRSIEILDAEEVISALKGLPFDYHIREVRPPKGAESAFRGSARGPRGGMVNFSISLGSEPLALAVPGAGTSHAILNGSSGFTFNDDTAIGKRFHTMAEWHEASHMATAIEERLCVRATGEPCAV